MPAKRKGSTREGEAVKQIIEQSINDYFKGQIPILCSLQDAAKITGFSYDFVLAQSKTKNKNKIPGFCPGKKAYKVFTAELPDWFAQLAERN